jgi:hypothetical protein
MQCLIIFAVTSLDGHLYEEIDQQSLTFPAIRWCEMIVDAWSHEQ